MTVFVLVYILLIVNGWINVFHGDFGALAWHAMIFTLFFFLMIGIPAIYKHRLKKKLKSGEMTERQIFEKMMSVFGAACIVIAYGITLDKYFWNDPDNMFNT